MISQSQSHETFQHAIHPLNVSTVLHNLQGLA